MEHDAEAHAAKARSSSVPTSASDVRSPVENAEIPDAVWFMLCEFMDKIETMFLEVCVSPCGVECGQLLIIGT